MIFPEHIKQLREQLQLPQRKLAAELEIDTATYCKIEKGDRKAKREQVAKIAELLHVDPQELLTLWLADKVIEVVAKDEELAKDVLNVVKENTIKYERE